MLFYPTQIGEFTLRKFRDSKLLITSVPAHVEMMGSPGIGNVSVAVLQLQSSKHDNQIMIW